MISHKLYTSSENEGENVEGTGPVIQWLRLALSNAHKSADTVHRPTWGRKQMQGYYILGCNAMKTVEIQQIVWRNMSPPSTGSNNM
jgi:hypothetical protein